MKATAKTMAKGAAEKNSFTPADLGSVYRKGTEMGISKRAMGKAITKGVKQGNKAKKK